MNRARHILALAVLLGGCWASHGREPDEADAGPPPTLCDDADVVDGWFTDLVCPRTALISPTPSP